MHEHSNRLKPYEGRDPPRWFKLQSTNSTDPTVQDASMQTESIANFEDTELLEETDPKSEQNVEIDVGSFVWNALVMKPSRRIIHENDAQDNGSSEPI